MSQNQKTCNAFSESIQKSRERRTKRWKEQKENERGTVREGVHVPHSANKQKVNTGEGNTVTLDAADRSSTCPLGFPRRPFSQPLDKSSAKSQHLSSPEAVGDKRRWGEKAKQHLCLLRLKHVAFSASLPSFFPQR